MTGNYLQQIRSALEVHLLLPAPWRRPMRMLVTFVEHQQKEIDELKQELQRAKVRHDEHVVRIQRDIERLKGTHGA